MQNPSKWLPPKKKKKKISWEEPVARPREKDRREDAQTHANLMLHQ